MVVDDEACPLPQHLPYLLATALPFQRPSPFCHLAMTGWEAVSTGLIGGFVPLKGSEKVGEISLGDHELGFEEVGMEKRTD